MKEREINISPMFKWFANRFSKKSRQNRKSRKAQLLQEREFETATNGLDKEPVVASTSDLAVENDASPNPLPETIVTDDEQMAINIKMRARAEAEAEAARIINQAKQEVQEIKLSAEIATEARLATEKKATDLLSTVKKKTELIEAEAKQRTLLYLLKAREEIEKQIREDYKKAYSRLSASLQDLMSEGQNIEVELKNKRITLWESKSFELEEMETALIDTAKVAAPPPETLTPEEKTEHPTELKEEATEEKIDQPDQPQEEISREQTEQPTELKEETPEEKIDQPDQLQEEAPVSEPVETITEEPSEQHPPEKVLDKDESLSTKLNPEDSQTLYTGEIELAIAIPVELSVVSKLYSYLQTISDIKVLRTTGSWDRGTTVTVVADKPIPLISLITKIPDVEVIPELLNQDSSVKGKSSSRSKEGEKEVTRIKLTLKEASTH